MAPGAGGTAAFAAVVGQPRAVAQLEAASRAPVHAYLFVGPTGFGTRDAAHAFAAALLCPAGGCGTCEVCRRALGGLHPDLVVVERTGASIAKAQIDEVLRLASRPPVEGTRKVIVLVDLHLVAQQYPRLLKTLEEPPASTVFVVLAEDLPPELITIASRCVRVDFGPVPAADVEAALRAEGVAPAVAAEVAAASGGRLDRARLLARDAGFAARQAAWRTVPERLDGSGAVVAAAADEILAAVETVIRPLVERQAAERAALEERLAATGERGGARLKELDEEHRRQQRRLRTDELRAGLATLASAYRSELQRPGRPRQHALESIAQVQQAAEALVRNPNESLLLLGLFARLSPR